jgi:hypothetical protein
VNSRAAPQGVGTVQRRLREEVAGRKLDQFWSILERLSERVQGQLHLRKLGAPAEFASIWIVRTDRKERPRFRSFAFALPLRVPTERVEEKLRHPYVCTLPLELLAYKEIGELAYIDDLDAIQKVVVEHLAARKSLLDLRQG